MSNDCPDCKEIVKHGCEPEIPPILVKDAWVTVDTSYLEYDIVEGETKYNEVLEILIGEIKKLKKEIQALKKLG